MVKKDLEQVRFRESLGRELWLCSKRETVRASFRTWGLNSWANRISNYTDRRSKIRRRLAMEELRNELLQSVLALKFLINSQKKVSET